MRLPHAENAVVDIRKLRDYCLNTEHDEGKHKARLFVAALGMNADDAEALQAALLEAATTQEAETGRKDAFGQRYTIDFKVDWRGNEAVIRSGWILENDSDTPRLTTCYPL
jgi:hypothetical protein